MDDLSKRSTSLDSGASGGVPADPAAVAGLTGAIEQTGGLDGLVGKLHAGGLGREVDSWVSTGPNAPVDPEQLGQALGPDTVQQLSSNSGIDVRSLLPLLAMFLPQIIDMLTKNGSTAPPARAGCPTSAGCSADSSVACSAAPERAPPERRGRRPTPTSATCSAGWEATSLVDDGR